jgi:hypothetical protein
MINRLMIRILPSVKNPKRRNIPENNSNQGRIKAKRFTIKSGKSLYSIAASAKIPG